MIVVLCIQDLFLLSLIVEDFNGEGRNHTYRRQVSNLNRDYVLHSAFI